MYVMSNAGSVLALATGSASSVVVIDGSGNRGAAIDSDISRPT